MVEAITTQAITTQAITTQTITAGHNYIGHNYTGHNYMGHKYSCACIRVEGPMLKMHMWQNVKEKKIGATHDSLI